MSDLIAWAQGPGDGLTEYAQPVTLPDPRLKKSRSRPNNGRKKRTDRTPGLSEPPWDMLRGLGVYIPPGLTCLPYTPTNWRTGGVWTKWRAQVHAMWGTTCHLCGHGEAHTADHLIPLSVWSNQPYDPYLSRPAHGVDGCPTCYVKCNSSRGNKELARQIGQYQPPVAL